MAWTTPLDESTLCVASPRCKAMTPVDAGMFRLGHFGEVLGFVVQGVTIDVVDDLTAENGVESRSVPVEMGAMNVTAGIDGGPMLLIGWEPDHPVLVAAAAPGVVTALEVGMVWTGPTLSGVDFCWDVAAFVAAGHRAEPREFGSGVNTGERDGANGTSGSGLHAPHYSMEEGL